MSAENIVHRRCADDWKPAVADAAEGLRETVLLMDELSQDGFGRIKGLANLALLSLETPEGHRHTRDLAEALKAIGVIAEDTQASINSEAEAVGCNYQDKAWLRRIDARRAFQDSQREGVAA